MIQGQCQCGSIIYKVASAPFDCCYCYCSICRKLTGSVSGAYGTVPKKDFEWLSGKSLVSKYEQNDNLERSFCSKCGSFLLSEHQLDPENVFLSLGCLSAHESIKIEYQQFVDSRADWCSVSPEITSHAAWPKWVLEKARKMHNKNQNNTPSGPDAA